MLQKSSVQETAQPFLIGPTKEHYLMDISRETHLAHTSTLRNLQKLLKDGLITRRIDKKGKRTFPVYRANRGSTLFKREKMFFNLRSLFDSGFISYLEEKLAPKSLVLFGSYLRGEDIETSDIDLFVECDPQEIEVATFEKKLKRKIELHFQKSFSSYPKELKNNIANGFVLSGYLEVYS